MMPSYIDSAKIRKLLFVAVAAVAVLPANAFACWDVCVSTFGSVDYMYGSYWELDHCTRTYTSGSSEPHTTCYYRRIYQN